MDDNQRKKVHEYIMRLVKQGKEMAASRKAKEERFRQALGFRLKTPRKPKDEFDVPKPPQYQYQLKFR